MRRTHNERNSMKQVSIKFSDDEWCAVEGVAAATGLKRPDVIRQLILRYSDKLIKLIGVAGKKRR